MNLTEDEHHEIPDASPAAVLRDLMDANDLTGAALSDATALPRSLISELLAARRASARRG